MDLFFEIAKDYCCPPHTPTAQGVSGYGRRFIWRKKPLVKQSEHIKQSLKESRYLDQAAF